MIESGLFFLLYGFEVLGLDIEFYFTVLNIFSKHTLYFLSTDLLVLSLLICKNIKNNKINLYHAYSTFYYFLG